MCNNSTNVSFTELKKMKLVLGVLLLVVGVFAEKELIDSNTEDATNLLTKRLWTQIRKRLKDYGYSDTDLDHLDRELDDEQCIYNFQNGTIIRTHDSIEAGATFINSQIGISREECTTECCSVDNCNIAVFKEKDNDHSCYLFDCGTPNICKFTKHPGYTVIALPDRTTTDKVLEKHEDDLEQLADTPTTTTTTTTTTTPVPTTTSPTPEPEKLEPVSLFGKCKQHKDCAGSWTQCLGGYCVCKDGYHEQEGTCRKDCSKFEFECHNTGQPLAYPQCVAIYNKCDGIALCKDGSDEADCDTKGKKVNHFKAKHTGAGNIKNVDADSDYTMVNKQELPAKGVHKDVPLASKEASVPEAVHSSSEDSAESDSVPVKDADLTNQKEKPISDSSKDTLEEQSVTKEKSKNSDKSSESSDSKSSSESNGENVNKTNEKENQQPDKNSKDVQSLGRVVQVVLSQEEGTKLEEAGNSGNMFSGFYKSNKGAVVALSLGLCITAMLLIFIGCRLRNVKKRLRRGRPLNSNEADYLINGMYL